MEIVHGNSSVEAVSLKNDYGFKFIFRFVIIVIQK